MCNTTYSDDQLIGYIHLGHVDNISKDVKTHRAYIRIGGHGFYAEVIGLSEIFNAGVAEGRKEKGLEIREILDI